MKPCMCRSYAPARRKSTEIADFRAGSLPRDRHMRWLEGRFVGGGAPGEGQTTHAWRPAARAVRSPDLPAMGAHHRLHECQPETASARFLPLHISLERMFDYFG